MPIALVLGTCPLANVTRDRPSDFLRATLRHRRRPARPIDLYEMTVEQARKLVGCRIDVFLEVGCPVDVGAGYTVVGGYEKEDGVSKSLILRGERHEIDPGDKLVVSGVLRVIEHDEDVVNGMTVPDWTEIRVEQVRPVTHPLGQTSRRPQSPGSGLCSCLCRSSGQPHPP